MKFVKQLFCIHKFKKVGQATIIELTSSGMRSTTGGTNFPNCILIKCMKCEREVATKKALFVNNIKIRDSDHHLELKSKFPKLKSHYKLINIPYDYYLINKKYQTFDEICSQPFLNKKEYDI